MLVWLWVERLNCNGVDWKDTTGPHQLATMNCWLGVSQIHLCIWDSLVPSLGMRLHLGYSGITLSKHLLGSNHCYCDSTALTQGHLLLSKMQERKAWVNRITQPEEVTDIPSDCIFISALPPIKVSFTKTPLVTSCTTTLNPHSGPRRNFPTRVMSHIRYA